MSEKKPCTCKFWGHSILERKEGEALTIEYCPLHASAEEMLKTLEFLQKWIHEQFCPMADNPDNHMRMCNQARAALLKARGE